MNDPVQQGFADFLGTVTTWALIGLGTVIIALCALLGALIGWGLTLFGVHDAMLVCAGLGIVAGVVIILVMHLAPTITLKANDG